MGIMNKTNRRYGVIYSIIRGIARSKKQFQTSDIPGMTWEQAKNNISLLVRAGELVRLRGYSGWGSKPALYQLNQNTKGKHQ